ncbi:zona pellucida sperm-binding protein 3-like, partial [Plectropomus leopardus]|uniref:zona pellucida sperm-binding protein 3-like n=1 Tax=Plectropomus leopardus TaxID=160734 RepID=UPI001C4BE71F
MDRNLQRPSSWWIIVLISLSTLTESRLESHAPSRTHGYIRPQVAAEEQQHSAGLGVRPRPVVVSCHPDSMQIVVQSDMFDTGIQVDGRHLRLGADPLSERSACSAVPSGEAEFTIQASLRDCGTKLSSTTEKIIYSNILVYSPEPSSDGLLRLDGAAIPVQCHYEKRYAVDGISLHPSWVSSVSTVSAEDQIDFNLLLMS